MLAYLEPPMGFQARLLGRNIQTRHRSIPKALTTNTIMRCIEHRKYRFELLNVDGDVQQCSKFILA